jgi:phage shock protein E
LSQGIPIYVWIAAGVLLFLGLRRLLGSKSMPNPEQLQQLRRDGAQVVDVRSPAEFRSGHAPGSLNIPVDQLPARLGELDPARPVLLCCASGARAGFAKSALERSGFSLVHNVGAWQRLA